MSDQYTRITSGGSPLDKSSPVVGLLFGLDEERYVASSTQSAQSSSTTTTATTTTVLQIKDADDIPVEISDASKLQVELHTAVFPQHRVVGWYRVSSSSVGGDNVDDNSDDEPTAQDLQITQQLKSHYASSTDDDPNNNNNNNKSFCFCLLNVQKEQQKQKKKKNDGEDTKMKSSDEDDDEDGSITLNNELPINLFELKDIVKSSGDSDTTAVLVNIPDWQLETSDAERIAVERVMNEKPSEAEDGSPSHNPYIVQTKSLQLSLKSMKDRVKVIIECLEQMQDGAIPPDPSLLRQIQSLVSSLGPLSTLADSRHVDGLDSAAGHYNDNNHNSNNAAAAADDVEFLSHLAVVAKTVSAVQSYTEKFRVMHENRNSSTSTTSMSGGGSSGAGSIRSSAKDAIRQFGGF